MDAKKERPLVTLHIPPETDWVLAVRMVLSGAGALLGLGVDCLADLRMAADEACDFLLHQPQAMSGLTLAVAQADREAQVRLSGTWSGQAQGCQTPDLEITQGILETLMPRVSLEEDERGVYAIVFGLPLA